MNKALYILFASAILFACTGEKSSQAGGKFLSPKVVDKLMPEQYIFRSDTAYDYIALATRDQVTKAKQLFMQGLDLYLNQKNATGSIAVFRESVQYCPDPKTYNYLANAYVDAADTARADSALNVFFEPDHDMFYTAARIAALKRDTLVAIENLAEAFSYGFSNKKRIENDKVFDHLREHRGFAALVITYLKDDSRLKSMLFKAFLAEAPDLKLPFEMLRDSICETDMEAMYIKPTINYDYAPFISGMEDSRFSRDVSNTYYLVGKFRGENNTQCVLYKSVIVMADTLPPVDVKLAVFDSTGTLLDEMTFAQYELPETLRTGSISADGEIVLKENKMQWKNDPMENGYSGNEYTGAEFLKESRFRIDASGKLVSASEKAEVAKQ